MNKNLTVQESMFYNDPWLPRQTRSWFQLVDYKEGRGGYKLANGSSFVHLDCPTQLGMFLLENQGKFSSEKAFDYWFNYPKFCATVEAGNNRYLKKVVYETKTRRKIQGLEVFIHKSYLQWLEENLN